MLLVTRLSSEQFYGWNFVKSDICSPKSHSVKPFIPHAFFMNGLKNAGNKACSSKSCGCAPNRAAQPARLAPGSGTVPLRSRPLRFARGSHTGMLPAGLGSGAGLMVVKCCREAQDQWVCAPLEGCRWHDAPGTVAGNRMGAWTCWGAQDPSANNWRQPGNGAPEPCVGNVL